MKKIKDMDEWKERFDELQNDLIEMIENGKNVLIVGGRGVGKTIMLENLEGEGYKKVDYVTEDSLLNMDNNMIMIDDIYTWKERKQELMSVLIHKNNIQLVATTINVMRLSDTLKDCFDEIIEIPKRP